MEEWNYSSILLSIKEKAGSNEYYSLFFLPLLTNEFIYNKMKYLIKTERLIIRLAEPEDAEGIFSYRSDFVGNKYQGWFPDSVEEVRD